MELDCHTQIVVTSGQLIDLFFLFDFIYSGLDSISSIQVIKHLRQLAHDGRTIICVIHQPSSSLFQLFDDVYLLSNGYCIYNGSLEAMVDTFKLAGFNCPTNYYNPADYALEVASLQRGGSDNIDQLIKLAQETPTPMPSSSVSAESSEMGLVVNGVNNLETTPLNGATTVNIYENTMAVSVSSTCPEKVDYPVSTWRQIVVLTKRSTLCTLRDFVSTTLECFNYGLT